HPRERDAVARPDVGPLRKSDVYVGLSYMRVSEPVASEPVASDARRERARRERRPSQRGERPIRMAWFGSTTRPPGRLRGLRAYETPRAHRTRPIDAVVSRLAAARSVIARRSAWSRRSTAQARRS